MSGEQDLAASVCIGQPALLAGDEGVARPVAVLRGNGTRSTEKPRRASRFWTQSATRLTPSGE
ncbi:hypothetical protein ACQ86F_00300 [Streptomyces venezuelae ATCC 10712]